MEAAGYKKEGRTFLNSASGRFASPKMEAGRVGQLYVSVHRELVTE